MYIRIEGNICKQTDKKIFEDKKVKFENTYKNIAKIYQRIKIRNKLDSVISYLSYKYNNLVHYKITDMLLCV